MTPIVFMEFWNAAAAYADRDDRTALAERFIQLYDAHGNIDELAEIMGEDSDLDQFLTEMLTDLDALADDM